MIALCLVENTAILALGLLLAHGAIRLRKDRRVTAPAPALTRMEILLSTACVLINSGITLLGWWLWREGYITLRHAGVLASLADWIFIALVMDFAMYWLHRAAHIPFAFPLLHKTHHGFKEPRPLTLFALNPAESLSFGSLWLVLLVFYDATWIGISIYLTLNLFWGLVGHLGVEPLPRWVGRAPVLNWLGTSTFHAQHHQDEEHNSGFYTIVWDWLFGTLHPSYFAAFDQAASGLGPVEL